MVDLFSIHLTEFHLGSLFMRTYGICIDTHMKEPL